MLLAVSRVHESVPLFIVEGLKRRLGSLAGRKVAVLGLAFKADTDDERDSLSHKLVRLLERELADVVVHDPHVQTPTASFADAVLDADAVVIATNHTEFRGRDVLRAIADSAKRDAVIADPWDTFGARRCSATRASLAAGAAPRHEPRPRHRRRRHDRRGGRPPPPRRPRLGGPRLRPAHAAAVDARRLRGPHRRPARPRRGAPRDRRLLARHPPRRDRRRHRELPQAPVHAHRGQRGALQRRRARRARPRRRALRLRLVARWSSSARRSTRPPRSTSGSARCRARRTGSRSSPARSTSAPRTTSTACSTRSAARSTPTGPGEMPEDEPGIAHAVPDLIRKCLALPPAAPLPIFGDGTHTRTLTHIDDIADGIVTAMASAGGGQRGLQHLARARSSPSPRSRGSSGRRRAATRRRSRSSTSRRSRSTSSAAGRASRRPSGCWAGARGSACARGSAQTADWLRGVVGASRA